MTNSANKNEIVAFRRVQNGTLTLLGFYSTYGLGTGPRKVSPATPNNGIDPLTSQGSLVLSRDGCFLFAVNAGSHTISSFWVAAGGELTLADVVPSGGLQPNSLAVYGDLLYAYTTNTGSGTVTTYRINMNGTLNVMGSVSSTPEGFPMGAPIDCSVSWDGLNFYVLNGNQGSISVFYIGEYGQLMMLQVVNNVGLPNLGSQGMAVH